MNPTSIGRRAWQTLEKNLRRDSPGEGRKKKNLFDSVQRNGERWGKKEGDGKEERGGCLHEQSKSCDIMVIGRESSKRAEKYSDWAFGEGDGKKRGRVVWEDIRTSL